MGTTEHERQADAHREVMERLCREYGEALKTYDMAKAAGDSALAAQLELVVAEKSNVMQAYMERNLKGTDAVLH
ncbi:hypothetical protein [Pseudomonas sp. MIACH]|uniref:hypothetical protein n=1 Tax=Pseudomonas sp. MIACH TaxID=1078355 RepID=UPI00069F1A59|nr:hypothetical protein [Pseudomonas sp. MIACH]